MLREKGILDSESSILFRKIIGFRNIVVHCYTRVSSIIVLNILENRKYNDILRIAVKIAEWAKDRNIDP